MAAGTYVGTESYSLISAAEFYREELLKEVVYQYGDEGLNRFFDVFGPAMGSVAGQGMLLGQAQSVKTPDFWHVERGRFIPAITAGATVDNTSIAAGAASAPIQISTASHSADGTKSPIRVGDVYWFHDVSANTTIQVYATAVNKGTTSAHTVTLKPIKVTDTFAATSTSVVAGDKLIYVTNIFEEGSDGHEAMVTTDETVKGKLQIIKDSFRTTLTANSTYSEVQWHGGFGIAPGNYRVIQDERDAIARQFRNIDMALLYQENLTNTISGITRTTKGLRPRILDDGGINQTYASTFDMADFRAFNKKLNTYKCPNEYKWVAGYDLMDELEEVFHDYFNVDSATGGVSYGAYNGSKSIALSMGVKSFCRGGFTHHFKTWSEFSDPNGMGAIAAGVGSFNTSAFAIPMEKTMDYGSSDGAYGNVGMNPGGMVYPLMIRFLEGNGQNRYMQTTEFGTRGGIAKGTREDLFGYDYVSEVGLQARNIKDFAYISKAS